MKNTIMTEADIKALNIGNEYTEKTLREQLIEWQAINALVPCSLEYDDQTTVGTIWLDKQQRIFINKGWKGEYNIGCYNRPSNMSIHEINDLEKTLDKPNNFKVLNAKTIQRWIDHYRKLNSLITIKSGKNERAHLEYRLRIYEAAKAEGVTHREDKDGKGGWLESKYFELRYEFCDNGYISQRISINPYKSDKDDLDLFNLLSTIK